MKYIYTEDGDIRSEDGSIILNGTDEWIKIRTENEVEPLVEPYYVRRKKEFNRNNITAEELIYALWEKVMENKEEKAKELQERRIEIKKRIEKK